MAVSRIHCIPEQVGDAALLFDPASVDEIADAIYRFWIDDDLCEAMIAKGLKKASVWGQCQFNDRLEKIVAAIVEDKQQNNLPML